VVSLRCADAGDEVGTDSVGRTVAAHRSHGGGRTLRWVPCKAAEESMRIGLMLSSCCLLAC